MSQTSKKMLGKRQREDDGKRPKKVRDPMSDVKNKLAKSKRLFDQHTVTYEEMTKEILFLKNGGNILDFNVQSSEVVAMFEEYKAQKKASPSPAKKSSSTKSKSKSKKSSKTSTTSTPEVTSPRVKVGDFPGLSPSKSVIFDSGVTEEELIEIEQRAAHDAKICNRVNALKKANLWSANKLPKCPDVPRKKSNWDYMLDEMIWLSNDFREERKWKMQLAKTVSKKIQKHFQQRQQKQERTEVEAEKKLKKTAANIARQVLNFWNKIEKVVKLKHEQGIEEKKKEIQTKKIEFLVGQTERYSSILANDLQSPTKAEKESSVNSPSAMDVDEETEGAVDTSIDSNAQDRQMIITRAAAAATQAQPKGTTLDSVAVKTPVSCLLLGKLRDYQHIGLDWLVSMYDAALNGILADEMGLGKTIQTISLLAYLASERGIWGPHLIVVPTSVMLNWEREFKIFCPGLKILTYYGSQKERKLKRNGWSKPNAFHICITSYNLVLQDQHVFRRKKWIYLILDEAQNIKNFKSQRWQTLLSFSSQRRLLLTGTPLQNNLMELWSLMHFLMPHIFQSHSEFKEWFCNPVTGMIEGTSAVNREIISRLHGVLRPFILRRLKNDVEKQLPQKHEHIIKCDLSKRQRFLYDEFMSRSTTKSALKGSYIGMMNVLMQLRKVCNHPDLFETRPIVTPFVMRPVVVRTSSELLHIESPSFVATSCLSFDLTCHEDSSSWARQKTMELFPQTHKSEDPKDRLMIRLDAASKESEYPLLKAFVERRKQREHQEREELVDHVAYLNRNHRGSPIYGADLRAIVTVRRPVDRPDSAVAERDWSRAMLHLAPTLEQRVAMMEETVKKFMMVVPSAVAVPISFSCNHPSQAFLSQQRTLSRLAPKLLPLQSLFWTAVVHRQFAFPERRLIQYDCGKLQVLADLLRKLKKEGHRALIFTQMSKMLDVLEKFLTYHDLTYVRLDGGTKPEKRQRLMENFNHNERIFCFILSTRSGGTGVNLIGADTVIFYDSDWNPAMDAQAQDRCHRIGQTREVNIYRLVSDKTVEENILKKANQKRMLDKVAIDGGNFTTSFFKSMDIREMFDDDQMALDDAPMEVDEEEDIDIERAMAEVEDEDDRNATVAAQSEIVSEGSSFSSEFCDASSRRSEPSPIVSRSRDSLSGSTLDDARDAFHQKVMEALCPVERYAFRYIEEVTPPIDEEELEAMQEEVEEHAKKWEETTLQRIKQKEEAVKIADAEHQLFYQVAPER